MKFTVISDTHRKHHDVEMGSGDVLLHCGDFSGRGTLAEVTEFNTWLGNLDYTHKIIIAGNHDFLFERDPVLARSLITNAIYLEDESVEIEGVKIYGSPWQPWFYDWAFNLKRGAALAEKWALIPEDTDILITHGPPMGIGDITSEGEHAGCEDLLKRIHELNIKYHCFGHIHEDYGRWEKDGKTFINASNCDLNYKIANSIHDFCF